MIEIDLLKTKDENSKLNKTTQEIARVSGTIIDGCSILTPSVRVRNVSSIKECNYVYIPSLKRYYFVDDLFFDSNTSTVLKLKVDVLMSHRAEILNTEQIVTRQENNYNLYLNDTMYKVYNKDRITLKKLTGANDLTKNLTLALTVNGGA